MNRSEIISAMRELWSLPPDWKEKFDSGVSLYRENMSSSDSEELDKVCASHILSPPNNPDKRIPITEPITSILDFGCGVGRLSLVLRKYFDIKVVGVDISPSLLDFAPTYCQGFDNIDFLLTDGYSCGDVPKESVDLAISYYVFDTFPTRDMVESCFKSIASCVRHGGCIRIAPGNYPGRPYDDAPIRREGINLQPEDFVAWGKEVGLKLWNMFYWETDPYIYNTLTWKKP